MISLLACSVFLGIGVVLVLAGAHAERGARISSDLLALVCFVIFGPGALIGAYHLYKPPTVWLDAQGFTAHRPPFGTQRETWANVGPFYVWAYPRQHTVVYDGPAFAAAHPFWARLNRAGTRKSAAFNIGMGGMSAEELAILLNHYRDAYGGRGPAGD